LNPYLIGIYLYGSVYTISLIVLGALFNDITMGCGLAAAGLTYINYLGWYTADTQVDDDNAPGRKMCQWVINLSAFAAFATGIIGGISLFVR